MTKMIMNNTRFRGLSFREDSFYYIAYIQGRYGQNFSWPGAARPEDLPPIIAYKIIQYKQK